MQVELAGGATEWFLETLVTLLMPIIKYVAQDFLDRSNYDKLPWTIAAAEEDLYQMWAMDL